MAPRSVPFLLAGILAALMCTASLAPSSASAQMSEARRIALARRLQRSTVTVIAGPSTGSGFVVGRERWIVTNFHVVEPARGGEVRVRFGAGVELAATVIEQDPSHDLAILEVRGARVPSPPLELGDSDEVEVGQTVLAYGSPFGLDGTLTEGIVSARRDVPGVGGGMARRLIQTDAPINPGNSGGPLVDRRGRVIGVNTAILSRTGGSHGIGFAVPANYVAEVLDRVRRARREGTTTAATTEAATTTTTTTGDPAPPVAVATSYLGVTVEPYDSEGHTGLRVTHVEPGSPAHRAGILGASEPPPPLVARLRVPWTGHIITAIDGEPLRTADDLRARLASGEPGSSVRLSVTVGGVLSGDTSVTLGAPPASAPASGAM